LGINNLSCPLGVLVFDHHSAILGVDPSPRQAVFMLSLEIQTSHTHKLIDEGVTVVPDVLLGLGPMGQIRQLLGHDLGMFLDESLKV
jgi:hypothetical protein